MQRSSRGRKSVDEKKEKIKLIETEDSATGKVGLGVYKRYFSSIGLPFMIAIVFFNAMNQAMSVLSNCKFLKMKPNKFVTNSL